MDLSRLEEDFLGDLAQDDHQLFELFEFVRLHHGRDPALVRRIGRELLNTWGTRGWLEASEGLRDQSAREPVTIAQLLAFVDAADSLDAEFHGADTWLRLTHRAYADVEWLSQAS